MYKPPTVLAAIQQTVESSGFSMPSEPDVGRLLRSLVASKPGGKILELGTGLGLSLAWIVDGMDANTTVVSVESEPSLADVARGFFRDDPRVKIVTADGGPWLAIPPVASFDLIFADTWPGKYHHLDEALRLLSPGGIYVVDDMLPQDNWPSGHAEKADALRTRLSDHAKLLVTDLNWASGLIVAVKR